MAVKDPHPKFTAMNTTWELCSDCYQGEDAIKKKGAKYLPYTSGQKFDGAGREGTPGNDAYESYRTRAYFPDIYKDAVEAAVGIMHRKPPVIQLPSVLEPMMEKATYLGESLEMVLRNINVQQLISGRVGVLADIKTTSPSTTPEPVIVLYGAKAIINWDDTSTDFDEDTLRLVVLDESRYMLGMDLSWTYKNQYRILTLSKKEGDSYEPLQTTGVYTTAVMDDSGASLRGAVLEEPSLQGNSLEQIPFSFVNGKDISSDPEYPPLYGVAKLCLLIYRGEADYRNNLFMQGQDTLVRIGGNPSTNANGEDEPVRTGAGALMDVPLGGDAKYIGVSSQGLPEQRQALESDYARAIRKSGQLLDSTSRQKESGDALKIRVAAQTATLPQLAKAGAAGLEKVLKALAIWYGANPDEVVVTPNLDFTEDDLNGKTLIELVQAKTLGGPISDKTIHEWMVENKVTKYTYEEETAEIEAEEPRL